MAVGRALAQAAVSVADWLGDRLLDAALWAVSLLRCLPVRVGRLAATLWRGVRGLVLFTPRAVQAWQERRWEGLRGWLRRSVLLASVWLLTLLAQLLDLFGLGEVFCFLIRLLARVTPLTGEEIAAAVAVLGPKAVRYGDVRVAEDGLLRLVFALNRDRAFTTFYTLNLPARGFHQRANFAILLHELVHVYQYERTGSPYLGQCIYAQAAQGYGYGEEEGLHQALMTGKHFRHFNREQQAQIVQDYYTLKEQGFSVKEYLPFIAEMRAGDL